MKKVVWSDVVAPYWYGSKEEWFSISSKNTIQCFVEIIFRFLISFFCPFPFSFCSFQIPAVLTSSWIIKIGFTSFNWLWMASKAISHISPELSCRRRLQLRSERQLNYSVNQLELAELPEILGAEWLQRSSSSAAAVDPPRAPLLTSMGALQSMLVDKLNSMLGD